MTTANNSPTRLLFILGDITTQPTEAIVNAANSSLMGGGGVDGAIHRAGGPAILQQCREIVAQKGRLPVGKAVITNAGNMPAHYVIHTVGPVWHGGNHNESALLANAYRSCLELACSHNIKSIAFPSISTGAYRFPIKQAAHIAIATVMEFVGPQTPATTTANKGNKLSLPSEVRFVLFSPDDLQVYKDTYQKLMKL